MGDKGVTPLKCAAWHDEREGGASTRLLLRAARARTCTRGASQGCDARMRARYGAAVRALLEAGTDVQTQ